MPRKLHDDSEILLSACKKAITNNNGRIMSGNDGDVRMRQCIGEMRKTELNIGMESKYVRFALIS